MKKLISTKDLPFKDWLEARRKGIGGSDIAAICGYNSYKSPLSVFLDKTDQAEPEDEENIAAELGLFLEPFMSKKFEKWILKEEGIKVELQEMPWILQDDEVDYFLVNLDRWFDHPDRGFCPVEIKTTTEFKRKSWTDDEVPDEYYTQCQWQMMITGAKWCYLIVLIGNRTRKCYPVPRNDDVIAGLRKTGKDFWENFVEKEIAPAPDGTDSSMEALKTLYPEEIPGKEATFDDEQEQEFIKQIELYDNLAGEMKILKKKQDAIKQDLMAAMGDAEVAIIGGRKVTYKTVNIPERVQNAYSYRSVRIY